MGLFTGKVMAVALTGSLILGGVTFAGGETLDKVKGQLNNFQTTQVQYEANEEALKATIEKLTVEANEKITSANKIIKDREEKIQQLTKDKNTLISNLKIIDDNLKAAKGEITNLKRMWLI